MIEIRTDLGIQGDVLSRETRWRLSFLAWSLLCDLRMRSDEIAEMLGEAIEASLADLGEPRTVRVKAPASMRERRELAADLCRLAAAGTLGGREAVRAILREVELRGSGRPQR